MTARFIARLVLTVWAALAFRITLGPAIAIGGVQPDLIAAVVFYLTVGRGPMMGILGGFVLGVLVDIERPQELGLSSFAWATMAFATARVSTSVDLSDRILSSVVLFFAVLLAEAIRAIVVGAPNPGEIALLLVRWALPIALYTAIAAPLIAGAAKMVLGESRWLRGRS